MEAGAWGRQDQQATRGDPGPAGTPGPEGFDTGAILRTLESNRFVTGVTWVDGDLWHGTWEGESEIRQIDARDGQGADPADDPRGRRDKRTGIGRTRPLPRRPWQERPGPGRAVATPPVGARGPRTAPNRANSGCPAMARQELRNNGCWRASAPRRNHARRREPRDPAVAAGGFHHHRRRRHGLGRPVRRVSH